MRASDKDRVSQARERGYWVIERGDTLFAISRNFTETETAANELARELASLNSHALLLNNPGVLVVGAKLKLPQRFLAEGKATAPVPPRAQPPVQPQAQSQPKTPVPAQTPAPPLATVPAAPPIPASQATPAAVRGQRVLPLDVTINGAKGGTWVFVERDGILHVPADALEEWRLQIGPDARAIDFKGEKYLPLSAVPGYKARLNSSSQSVELAFAPEAFTAQRLSTAPAGRPNLDPVMPSVFLNYDANYFGQDFRQSRRINDVGVIAELGLSTRHGVLTTSVAGRNLGGDGTLGDERHIVRLESTYTRDFPGSNITLRVGDATTRAGLWGRNIYFGGVQIGTNFELTPGFVSQPIPVLRGLSASPSTVELYVNDVLRQVSTVPTGPFAIDNFPQMTGSGEARLVVRDILGRETVLVQPFFEITKLLAPGLNDWSAELGSVREEFGTASNQYADTFVSGTWRRGITQGLTLEGRAEFTKDLRVASAGASFALPWQFLGSVAAVVSDRTGIGRGGHWLVGLERNGLRNSISFQAKGASVDFRQLGQDDDLEPNKLQVAGNWTYFHDKYGALGLGFATISRYSDVTVSTVTGNYSVNFGKSSSLSFNVSRAVAGASGTSFGMSIVVPLENSRVVSATTNSRSGQTDYFVTANQTSGLESGLGWRVLAGEQQREARVEGGLYYLGRRGNVTGEVSASPDRRAVRLGASGGVVFADGYLFATRRVDQAFAVAEIAGFPDVGVGLGSMTLTKTNNDGVALIPNLWPYQANSIRLDANELPISAEVDSIEKTAVPAWRSGVKVTFPVRGGRGALLRIVLESGEVAPAGAIARIDGDKQEFYVARRGEAFVTGLQPTNRLTLTWAGGKCRFEATLPPEKPDEIARVGPLTCKAITP
ncbi:fimbria/pilus outer membrane usher protein [Usitatibacter palustris]|uniref:fimbria/pilus outer membrane usher protein n=1 Tax=Usitatibacter palustris TaxID=2732487 RepID=UPI001488C43F|nr:fimbria/pilus outer membrane usher protein [Usitatibacter palustris]